MTNEEALHEISTMVYRNTDDFEMKISKDCYKSIVNALEKQIPKVAEHEDGVWSLCPCCGGSVCNDTEHAVNKEVSYCEHCGQALDWSDEE